MSNRFAIKITGPAGFGIKVTGLMLAKYFLRQGFSVFAYTEYPSLIRGGHNTYQVDLACQIHPERSEGSPGSKMHEAINSVSEKCDILIALDAKSMNVEGDNLREPGLVIYDEKDKGELKEFVNKYRKKKIDFISISLTELARQSDSEIMKNTVALGALVAILELSLDNLINILKDEFKDKEELAEKNVAAAKSGYEYVYENIKTPFGPFGKLRACPEPAEGAGFAQGRLKHENNFLNFQTGFSQGLPPRKQGYTPPKGGRNLLITGNQACALGAIASQCQLYVAYPMTPASEILHYLAAKQRETGIVVHQPEDEIAGIHVALGASFAGVRAATGTSGGGFALMNEGLSLAGMVELPLVIFEVQRPAPATGNPTWTEQGDLLYVINAGHGEFPRLVVAPGNPEECFILTQKAFNLADKYQIPAIILSDKFLGESNYSVSGDIFKKIEKIERGKIIKSLKHPSTLRLRSGQALLGASKSIKTKELFMRYKLEKDGVSWRTIPGVDGGEYTCASAEHDENGVRCGEYIANSDEHEEFGFSNEMGQVRQRMMDKRLRKLEQLRKEIPLPKVYGPSKAEVTLVTWGSMWGPCLDAMESLKHENIKTLKHRSVNVVHFSYLWPLPKDLDKFLSRGLGIKKLVLVENNKTAQLGRLIRGETGIEIKDKILKYNSRPFWPEEIVEKIERLVKR